MGFENSEPKELIKTAAEQLRSLSKENQELKAQISEYEKRESAEKVAHELKDKGLISPDEIGSSVDKWLEEGTDLDMIKQAAEMASGKEVNKTWSGMRSSSSGSNSAEDDIVNFIMGLEN